jgi:Flp pilus assembly protein TadG
MSGLFRPLTARQPIISAFGRAMHRRATRFAGDESGTVFLFGLFVFLIILTLGGLGIDLMRRERDRTTLQYTLDRAVLAAADLDQTQTPGVVINDYLGKAGLASYLTGIAVDQGLGYRTVSASAALDFKTDFLHMSGIDTIYTTAASTAEERIDGVEISLVLDVSGSMNSNSRLTNLKTAARDFVDTMVANSNEGRLSISIVPYATQVSLPDAMIARFNVTNEHNYSNCVNFDASDFDKASIDTTRKFNRTMHFDPWYDYDGRDDSPPALLGQDYGLNDTLPVCEVRAALEVPGREMGREILPLQKSASTLKTYITNLKARGNTSIDLGMKWGAALLDPSLQSVVDGMITAKLVPNDFDDRPTSYQDGDTLKVIVLMTDGENTSQYYLNDDYRRGESNIWWNAQEQKYSVYVGLDVDDDDGDGITNEPLFYWPHSDDWHDHAYGEGVYEDTTQERVCTSYKKNGSCKRYKTVETTIYIDEPGSAALLSYGELWAYTSMEEIVEALYEPWMNDSQAWSDWYYAVRNYVNSSAKDARTKAICDAAKEKGVIVFTIGFEAPSGGKAVIKDCASSDSHFFDVKGLEISDAFSSIASSIRKLRLTQ